MINDNVKQYSLLIRHIESFSCDYCHPNFKEKSKLKEQIIKTQKGKKNLPSLPQTNDVSKMNKGQCARHLLKEIEVVLLLTSQLLRLFESHKYPTGPGQCMRTHGLVWNKVFGQSHVN